MFSRNMPPPNFQPVSNLPQISGFVPVHTASSMPQSFQVIDSTDTTFNGRFSKIAPKPSHPEFSNFTSSFQIPRPPQPINFDTFSTDCEMRPEYESRFTSHNSKSYSITDRKRLKIDQSAGSENVHSSNVQDLHEDPVSREPIVIQPIKDEPNDFHLYDIKPEVKQGNIFENKEEISKEWMQKQMDSLFNAIDKLRISIVFDSKEKEKEDELDDWGIDNSIWF